jgi:hypothetical protein
MAKKFFEKLNTIISEANKKLIKLIQTKGEESKFCSDFCLKIKDELLMFNLNGGRYLVEVRIRGFYDTSVVLIDNEGYEYSYYCIPTDQFVLVADHLVEVYSKKRRKK